MYLFFLFFACIHGHLMQAEAFGGQKKVLDSLEVELQGCELP